MFHSAYAHWFPSYRSIKVSAYILYDPNWSLIVIYSLDSWEAEFHNFNFVQKNSIFSIYRKFRSHFATFFVILYVNPTPSHVLILDGSSEHGAHIWSKSGISICWRHLVTSRDSSCIFFSQKSPILLHTCETWPELPSYISSMI